MDANQQRKRTSSETVNLPPEISLHDLLDQLQQEIGTLPSHFTQRAPVGLVVRAVVLGHVAAGKAGHQGGVVDERRQHEIAGERIPSAQRLFFFWTR